MAAYAALVSLAHNTDLSRKLDRYQFSMNAKEKIRSIHEYVIFILSFLEDFPEKGKRWEGEMRDLAHKIEEIMESYMWQQAQIAMKQPRVKLEELLEDVTEEIGLIAGKMMEERPANSPAAAAVSAPSGNNDAVVIGLDDDVLAIKERLCGQPSPPLQVIPIVGMAGIGKTTLAATIYNDPLILDHFDIRAWLTVSQDYRLGKILLGLVDSMKLMLECGEKTGESEMKTKVYQNLIGRRYLVVMDDVWSTKFWDDVSVIFPDNGDGSRIMLTTRLLDVAAYPYSAGLLHEMRFMNDSQSWDLLRQKVFANKNCPPELEIVGKEIARGCAGLPLAVVLAAGVLVSDVNTSRHSWEEIARNVNPVVGRELKEILSFSYTYLPHHLRPCFLFIGGFPEDENIRASILVNLWVAEGFLILHEEESSSKSLEDKAEEYLEDLVKRNLLLVTSRKSDGKIKSCSLHDMVRDLCVSKAEEEKFLRVVDGGDLPQGLMNERRISFNRADLNMIWGPTIRTILCFQLQNSSDYWLDFLQSSRLLKVLHGVGCNQKEEELPIPSQVFDLFHLTYLALIGSFNIPPHISSLVNLQTLIIHPTLRRQSKINLRDYNNASHFSLPLEIWRMTQLRHLILYDLYTLPHPPHVLPLENLQTLSHVENLVWSEKMVQMIPNVKRLGLVYALNDEYRLQHLQHLHQLENLHVAGYLQFSWQGQNPSFPMTLKKLSLVGGGFLWEDMSIVGSLPKLQVLKLRDHACDGERWVIGDDEFRELKYLVIDKSGVGQWVTQGSPFPKLQRLVLRSCESLSEIPESIGDITTLEYIEVSYCTRSVEKSAEQIIGDQKSYGNDVLQVAVLHSDEGYMKFRHLKDLIKARDAALRLASTQHGSGHTSMAAYAALVSLAQTIDLSRNYDRYQFSMNANDKIRSIHEYVISMLSLLQDFPEKAKRWEGEMRDLARKIEDIIEENMWQQAKIPMKQPRAKLEELLKDVMEEIGLIAGKMMEERPANLPAAVAAADVSSPSTTGNNDAVVIGLDEDLMAIKDRLCGQSSQLQVIPIVGMAGIGKTTLAATIYNDPLILDHFEIRSWLTVSQDYSPVRLLEVLSGLADSMELMVELEMSKMQMRVYQKLMGRRYLVVLDDVWSTEFWDNVRIIFPDNDNGSRIMLTTRLLDVAMHPYPIGPLHEMRFMNDSQSWDLLKQKVFPNNYNCPPELEDIGKEIARRCAGLPLAVVLVAGVLVSGVNASRDSWEKIARNVNLDSERELKEILSFSYTHLPHHLKQCFLFIGGLPEDENIRASTLVNLWVAEGFSKLHEKESSSRSSLEEKAEEYLEELVKRNLVVVTSRKSDGKIKSCGLHDMVRDLCMSKAKEEKFLHKVDGDGGDRPLGLMNERRISFNRADLNVIRGLSIRTILCFQLQNSLDCWLDFLQSSRLLKVLHGVGCYQEEEELPIPSLVFELFHLTYLALVGSFNIPPHISNLANLQTLIIHPALRRQSKRKSRDYNNAAHFSLPLEIWRMTQLRHLILYDLYMLPHPPESNGSDLLPLENLQTLLHVENLVWSEKMVQMIPNVKKLGIVYALNQEYKLQHLQHLHQLENLQVAGYQQFSWRGQNRTSFPLTLKKLSLVGGGFSWEDMSIIGSLPNLQVLKLRDHACDGETWEIGDEEFAELKYLVIDKSRLVQWETESSSPFPKLQRLVLRSCESLREIPESIGEIPTLEYIEVSYCSRRLAESAKQIIKKRRSCGNHALKLRVMHIYDEVDDTPKRLVARIIVYLSEDDLRRLHLNNIWAKVEAMEVDELSRFFE